VLAEHRAHRVMRTGEGVYAISTQWYKQIGVETSLE
jgi:hypothetical protein